MEFKNLSVNLNLMGVYIDGKALDLTKTEYRLLIYLLENKNKICTRDEISEKVLIKNTQSRNIDVVVSRIRKKLGDLGKYIIAKQGLGYEIIE